MIEHVRIVVAGDAAVGKTSLIKTLVSEVFEETVPDVLPTVLVPPEVTPERVPVSIIDTPSVGSGEDSESLEILDEELRNASVIVLVYDVSRPTTLERISTFWLRKIREMNLDVPVTLAGNKIDTRASEIEALNLEALIKPIMEEHRELEVCIECSAKQIFNVAEVFYFAQKSVLHPTAPLYDVATHSVKPRAAAALTRVFRLCDKDGDGELNDFELNEFQVSCFNVKLKNEELMGVKNVVKENCEEGVSVNGGVTLPGFVFLHTLFIQKGRLETTWTVLRKFGYNEDLVLGNEHATQVVSHLQPDQVVTLSPSGLAFLNALFDTADLDKDEHLSVDELEALFLPHPQRPWATTPTKMRLVPISPTKGEGYMTREAFLDRWRMNLVDDPEEAILSLVYLGLPDNAGDAVSISPTRRRELRSGGIKRDTLVVAVLGGHDSGKTELVRGLISLPFDKGPGIVASSSKADQSVGCARSVNVDQAFGGGSKTLIMHTVPESRASAFVSSKSYLESCDVAVLVYDGSIEGTFADTVRLYDVLSSARSTLPIIFVCSKADLPQATQVCEDGSTPEAFCESHGIPEPQRISMKEGETASIYEMLVGVGLNPQVAVPGLVIGSSFYDSYAIPTLKAIGIVSAIGLVGYGSKKLYDRLKNPKSVQN